MGGFFKKMPGPNFDRKIFKTMVNVIIRYVKRNKKTWSCCQLKNFPHRNQMVGPLIKCSLCNKSGFTHFMKNF